MIELVVGPMFAGKTTHFIKRINELREEGKNVIIFKPVQDFRYSKNDVVTHDGISVKGLAVDEVYEIKDIIDQEDCDVLAVDEVQFFGWDFVEIVNELADNGIHVLLAGLDTDFTGRPFSIMPDLMSYSDVLLKLNGICSVCGGLSSKSQRLVNGFPASEYDQIVVVDESVTYEPRCRLHHEIIE